MFGLYYNFTSFVIGYSAGLRAFTAAVLGGIGNVPGAMLGGMIIGLIETLSGQVVAVRWDRCDHLLAAGVGAGVPAGWSSGARRPEQILMAIAAAWRKPLGERVPPRAPADGGDVSPSPCSRLPSR